MGRLSWIILVGLKCSQRILIREKNVRMEARGGRRSSPAGFEDGRRGCKPRSAGRLYKQGKTKPNQTNKEVDPSYEPPRGKTASLIAAQ